MQERRMYCGAVNSWRELMLKTAIYGVSKLFARRKIEAATLSVIAAISAVGLVRGEVLSADAVAAVPLTNAVHVATAIEAAVTPKPSTSSAGVLDLPNLAHPRVDSWIKRFTTTQRSSFATYLARMTRYEAMISRELAERDMPQGLIYLAMIESGFNPTAKSPVKATGLWQFMSATGKEYGLTVTKRVDERKNPTRATEAALEYLSDLHDRFGSWYLAAAAYNTGQGRVARVMKQVTGRQKGTDADYYRIAHKLPKETREYVPKMIAAARIGSNPTSYGFR
jgi:membrane-bound lytic murein transglycosylase D